MAEASQTSGLAENVAALLSYVFGWITGIIMFLIDKRPFVRFHAAQSIVVFGALHIIKWVLVTFLFAGAPFGWFLFSPAALVIDLINLAGIVLWIVLMIKA